MLHVTVRHVPYCKTYKKYYLETTIYRHNSRYVLYKVLQMASLFSGDERFENNSTCFSLDDLSDAIFNDTLLVSRKFIKHQSAGMVLKLNFLFSIISLFGICLLFDYGNLNFVTIICYKCIILFPPFKNIPIICYAVLLLYLGLHILWHCYY